MASDKPISLIDEKSVLDRPSWRARKERHANTSTASADDVVLPEDPNELRNLALRTAVAIMGDKEAMPTARVAATKLLLEATVQKPREYIIRLLDGDEEAYERWLRNELADLEAKRGAS